MKLEGLRILQQELGAAFKEQSVSASVYYVINDTWYDLATELCCDPTYVTALENARQESVAYHTSRSTEAWYYLEKDQCAVRLTFSQSPRVATRRRYRKNLTKIQETATNAYKVSHNPLTHLLARDEFRRRLSSEINSIDHSAESSNEIQEGNALRLIAVLSLDIDHFKQVNDTWGHLYGDQVLKIFARRLEHCASSIRANSALSPRLFLGHPSGEEFLVYISANTTRDQLVEWANDFRKTIMNNVIPTDEEWQWLGSLENLTQLSLPVIHERSITASVGFALHSPATLRESGEDAIASLLDKADTALYRAKAAGRNQVILYDEILNSCGRVLEYNPGYGVVALDIGSNVGVTVGQEFKVFAPIFTGKAKFTINDGRTTRTLGNYPRVQAARIVVFDAQPEISFALIPDSPDNNSSIEPNSHLEAIPAGSIGHLLPTSSKYNPSSSRTNPISSITAIQNYLKTNNNEISKPFAIVFRLTREADYLKKYGSVALNSSLALLYREVHVAFQHASFVEVIDRGSLCVVGKNDKYVETLVSAFINRLTNELSELDLFAGIFCEADRAASEREDQETLTFVNALEFARYAATDVGRSADTHLRHFSYQTVYSVFGALYDARAFEVAETDFNKLIDFGLRSSRLYNYGALIARGLGKLHVSITRLTEAVKRSPTIPIYRSNLAAVAYDIGDTETGLKVLNELPLEAINSLLPAHKYGFITYVRMLAKAKLAGLPSFMEDRFHDLAEVALQIPDFQGSPGNTVIQQALDR